MAVSVAAVLELAPKSPTAPKLNETESAGAGAAGQTRGEARPSSRAQTAGTSRFLTGAPRLGVDGPRREAGGGLGLSAGNGTVDRPGAPWAGVESEGSALFGALPS